MAFQTNSFAKVWEVKPSERYTDVRVSTSKKRKDGSGWDTDFSGFVRLIGEAHEKAKRLQSGDRIRLGKVSATITKNPTTEKYMSAFQCYSYKEADDPTGYAVVDSEAQNQTTAPAPKKYDPSIPEDVTDEELPFN